MAAVASTPALPGGRIDSRWIIGRGVDLTFVIGSAAAGYLYILLFAAVHAPISWLWWVWSVGFDGTHIFATASRTFFDSEARARHRTLFFGSVAIFFSVGPLMVLAGLKGWLYLLVGVWAYYHVIRQHYGFMVLYKVKNRDLKPLDNAIDRIFLGIATISPPFHRFLIHHPEELGLPFSFPRLETPLWILLGTTCAVYAARQWQRWRAGDRVDAPKFLLLAG